MAGIDSIINTRADAFTNNPQGLMQRYAMSQDLLDLLALQKLKQDKEAAQRSLQMQMQAPQNTVKDQLEGQVMDMTKQEVAQSVGPGIQQQGQQMQAEQLQQAMGAGLGGLQAPAGLGMAQGGIVGYAGPEGSSVRGRSRTEREFVGPPLTPWQIRQAEKSKHREGGQQLAQSLGSDYIADAAGWAKENPVDAASLALLTYAGAGPLLGLGRGALSLLPRAARMIARNPRLSAAGTAVGLQGLEALIDYDSEAEAADPAAEAPREFVGPPILPTRPAPAAPAPVGLPAALSDAEIGRSLGSSPVVEESAATEQPAYRSRYEDRLDAIEAEKGDKMGALIDFLLAAGASGGTNLGATLTGGGSGLRARDARLKQEEADTLKNLIAEEQLSLDRQSSEWQAQLDRENRLEVVDRQVNAGLREVQTRLEMGMYEGAAEAKAAQLSPGYIMSNYPNLVEAYAIEWKRTHKGPGFFGSLFTGSDEEYEEQAMQEGVRRASADIERQIDSFYRLPTSSGGAPSTGTSTAGSNIKYLGTE